MIEVTEKDNVTSNDRILKESDRINKIKKWSIRISVAGGNLLLCWLSPPRLAGRA